MQDVKWLWHSNSAEAPTGYGNQTRLFTPLIKADSRDCVISALYGRLCVPSSNTVGVVEFPIHHDQAGNDIITAHMETLKANAVISLYDPLIFKPHIWQNLLWCAWAPVDCEPLNLENEVALRAAHWVWSMSQFGHRQLTDAGFRATYVPHGVDTEVYKPMDRREARAAMAKLIKRPIADDTYLIVTNAANKGRAPSRKNWFGAFRAFKRLVDQFKAMGLPMPLFYCHTDPVNPSGEPLEKLVKDLGIADYVAFPDAWHYAMGQYRPEHLNQIYNAADIFFLPSLGEGFGIPIVEAQAAGCPVVVTDGTSMSELCFSGERVTAIPVQADAIRAGRLWYQPLEELSTAALLRGYERRDREAYRQAARQGALAYDYRTVYTQYMKPALEAITQDLYAIAQSPTERAHERGKLRRQSLNRIKENPLERAITSAAD